MSRMGNVWDTATALSVLSSLKIERTKRQIYQTRVQACADVVDDIEMFYNLTHKHSTNGMLSPVDYELGQKQMNDASVS